MPDTLFRAAPVCDSPKSDAGRKECEKCGLAQAMLRHGFDPERGIVVSPLLGAFSAPGTSRRAVEPLDYAQLRGYLEAFVAGMDSAKAQLLAAGEHAGFAVEIDVTRIRFDLDGDSVGDNRATVGALLCDGLTMSGTFDRDDPRCPSDAMFAFDAADAIWLAGYSQVLAVQVDFLLAHDFETTFDVALHRVFPGAGCPWAIPGAAALRSTRRRTC
ncbi:hypothetical protein [Pelagibacterium halotolerans]|uniref:hypothetical protein n=1 Tax=Pelagibacterium halotolerans TaxID=531813 RepID=UPI00384BB5C7